MTSVDKYVLIPFNKYQKLLKGANTKEPNSANPLNTNNYERPVTSSLSSLQIGRGNRSQSGTSIKEVSEAANNVNTSSGGKTNTHPPPGIPMESVKINSIPLSNKSLFDKEQWLSYWEEL